MLKSCWECLAGSGAFGDRREDVYGTHVNGAIQQGAPIPQWPTPMYDNEIMFLLPKSLQAGDAIIISGNLRSNPETFILNLVTGSNSIDYQNIAYQLSADFRTDSVTSQIIEHGTRLNFNSDDEIVHAASDIFANESFELELQINKYSSHDKPNLDIYNGGNSLQTVSLVHRLDQIRYLTCSGDVDKVTNLTFQFA